MTRRRHVAAVYSPCRGGSQSSWTCLTAMQAAARSPSARARRTWPPGADHHAKRRWRRLAIGGGNAARPPACELISLMLTPDPSGERQLRAVVELRRSGVCWGRAEIAAAVLATLRPRRSPPPNAWARHFVSSLSPSVNSAARPSGVASSSFSLVFECKSSSYRDSLPGHVLLCVAARATM